MGHKATSDGYVRIAMDELPKVQLRHLTSAIDLSIAVTEEFLANTASEIVTGYTEWIGSWQELVVSVGWDWGVVRNSPVLINPDEIRTNVQLLAANEQAATAESAKIDMLKWIESHPWKEVVIQRLFPDEQV